MRSRNDSGESLIELIVTIAVLGITVVALVSGIGTGVVVSDTHRKQATAAASVRTWAETVEAAVGASPSGYVPCATTSTPAYLTWSAPAGYTRTITSIGYWNGSSFTAACGTDGRLQRLVLTVRSTDGRATESLVVVLRRPCREADAACA